MYRPYVTDLPARKDLSFRTNDDRIVAYVWLSSDGVTPVEVESAELTLEFDIPVTGFDPDTGDPLPDPTPVREILSADPAGFSLGQVLVVVPAVLWPTITGRSGNWDLMAVSTAGVQRCLARGLFTVEDGITQ